MLIYVTALISLLLCLIAGVPYIRFLQDKLYNQTIREEGPKSHAVKEGTPTTGGIIIVLSAVIAAILGLIMDQKTNIEVFLILLTFSLSTFIGFRDDLIKIQKQRNKGLSARNKLLLQILVASIPALYVTSLGETTVSLFNLAYINLGILYPIFAIFVIIGSSNAVNLTDGLDGLASGVTAVAMFAVSVISVMMSRPDIAIVSAAIGGSCIGFLYFNKHPAKMFMGDTGSLALGTALGTTAVIGKFEIWLLLIGIIFVLETLSVMIQVTSFKLTGKRVFKMAPLHHHFELIGWKETKVVYVFWTVGLIFALVGCYLKFYLS